MPFRNDGQSGDGALLADALVSLVRAFVSWMVISPMILAWGTLIFLLFALTLVNFTTETTRVIDFSVDQLNILLDKYPSLGFISLDLPSAADSTEFFDEAFKQFIFRVYAMLAMPFVILGTIFDVVRNSADEDNQVGIRRKIRYVSIAVLSAVLILLLIFLFGSENHQDDSVFWLFMFIATSAVVWLISVACLIGAHVVRNIELTSPESAD